MDNVEDGCDGDDDSDDCGNDDSNNDGIDGNYLIFCVTKMLMPLL